MAEFTALILSIQALMHLAITIRLAIYKPLEGDAYKPGVSFLAAALAGSSAVIAYNIAVNWRTLTTESAHPFTTTFVAVVFIGVMKSRGNLAYFLPRI